MAQFTDERIEALRFVDKLRDEMEWIYGEFGEKVYASLSEPKAAIFKHFEQEGIKLSPKDKKALLDVSIWKGQHDLMEAAKELKTKIGEQLFNDFNAFQKLIEKSLKELGHKLSAKDKKQLYNAITWKDESAKRVIKKKEKDGNILYEPDSELRDTENVPLHEDIHDYFAREVLPHVPDAWIDESKTTVGYEISFTKYFYQYDPLRSLEEITKDLIAVEKESDGLLRKILMGNE